MRLYCGLSCVSSILLQRVLQNVYNLGCDQPQPKMFTLTLRMQGLHCFHPLLMARFSVSMQHIMVNALRIFSRVGSVFGSGQESGQILHRFSHLWHKNSTYYFRRKTPWSLFYNIPNQQQLLFNFIKANFQRKEINRIKRYPFEKLRTKVSILAVAHNLLSHPMQIFSVS